MTFQSYVDHAEESFSANAGNWRRGQAYFNVLRDRRPDLAERLTLDGDKPFLDPFNVDGRIPQFLAWLETEWNVGSQSPLPGTTTD